MKGLVHTEVLAPNGDRAAELGVIKGVKCGEEGAPAPLPMCLDLRPADRPPLELFFAVAPGFLTIARQEVGEAGAQVTS